MFKFLVKFRFKFLVKMHKNFLNFISKSRSVFEILFVPNTEWGRKQIVEKTHFGV